MHSSRTRSQKPPTTVFLAATVMLFFLSLSAADSIGFVPDYLDGTAPVALKNLPELGEETVVTPNEPEAPAVTELPKKISIPSISLDLTVLNPNTRDIAKLDEYLKSGPVRYVDSAKLGTKGGNVIIFAHTSHLPVVRNQMYKAFNRIPELKAGDTITLTGESGETYLYSVKSVRKVNAEDTTIDMSTELGTRLTLVTCDTLTSKSSRFVLEADLIGSTAI